MTQHTTAPGGDRPRRVLLVTAHPEPRSLTSTLSAFAEEHLRGLGHEVRTSDLHAMKWKPVLDAEDFPAHPDGEPLVLLDAQTRAQAEGRLPADVLAEQEKIRWADAVVLQFPLWWFGVPAILKGWLDRVFTPGFAHGPALPAPYTAGSALGGRRALLVSVSGSREGALSDRGVHGPLTELLHPIQHGVFWFTGMAPLEPFGVYGSHGLDPERFAEVRAAYAARLDGLFGDPVLPYLPLDEEHYDHDMRLLPGRGTPGAGGLALHRRA
ncbi:NAD(P)H-dependent oxidoreductase [Streptomyces sp. BI20]|uniref:NAD(P)H-dependent oxidoreductase n=1 Tax=Streptomyces sp. BI20 TaxID=3403460 RepID=UPI003C773D7B